MSRETRPNKSKNSKKIKKISKKGTICRGKHVPTNQKTIKKSRINKIQVCHQIKRVKMLSTIQKNNFYLFN